MKLNKKVTDFIRLEEGNIGRKSAVVTGALFASTVLGGVLVSMAETENPSWVNDPCHLDGHYHSSHNTHTDSHTNEWEC
jgi:hypothetical protein